MMKKIMAGALVTALAVLLLAQAGENPSGSVSASEAGLRRDPSAARPERMQWWREAKFGMFIHWGLYSQLAGSYDGKEIDNNGEWIMDRAMIPVAKYAAVAKDFNPVKFDAAEWVRIAKCAGMKYIVITAKHHDGFAMYPSQASAFNLHDASPFKRDPLAELSEACRKEGLRFGLYYSQALDWHHPGGALPHRGAWDAAQKGDMAKYIDTIAVPQVREICTRYGPLAELWWDMPSGMTPQFATQLLAVVQATQPDVIMNNRLGGGVKGDLETPEQFIPSTGGPAGRDWETCMTMNNTWGFKKQDTDWKSTEDLLRKLLDICHKGGNFLLNVGPTAEGVIPLASVERLAAIGAWLQKNGESVYGTSASPMPFLSWGRCTRKGQTLFLHVFDWPASGELRVPMHAKVTGACLLARPGEPLQHEQRDGAVVIHVPRDQTAPSDPSDKLARVIKLTIEGEPVVAPPLTLNKPARASAGNAALAFDGTASKWISASQHLSRRWPSTSRIVARASADKNSGCKSARAQAGRKSQPARRRATARRNFSRPSRDRFFAWKFSSRKTPPPLPSGSSIAPSEARRLDCGWGRATMRPCF